MTMEDKNKELNDEVEGKELGTRQHLEQYQDLLDMALADGVLTDQEKEIIIKQAQFLGVAQFLLEAKMKELSGELHQTSEVSSNSELSVRNYQKEFNEIKHLYRYRETQRFKKECCEFIDSIYPINKVETIAALDFLSSFLPPSLIDVLMPKKSSCEFVYKYDRDFAQRAVPKLKTIIKESEDEFYEDVDVMKKVRVVKERLGTLANTLEKELEKLKEQLTNSDKYYEEEVLNFNKAIKPFRKKRYIRWSILGIALAAAWLLAGYGWWWSVIVNVLTLAAWTYWYMEIGCLFSFEYYEFKEDNKPTIIKKADKERELKNTISQCKNEIDFFRL